MKYVCTNVYYFSYLNRIGGIESHLYYIAQKYGKYDITVFYRNGDKDQINRLRKYVKTVKLNAEDTIECDIIFCCFNRDILKQCKAKKKCLVLHGDYKDMVDKGQLSKDKLPIDNRIDQYYGVSQLVCDSWYQLTGIKAINLYQPVIVHKSKRPLKFLSATRLTNEKGWDRMVILADMLNKANISFRWDIYTDSNKQPVKNMYFYKPRLDVANIMSEYDGFIQLSDNEGFCLSVVESWINGTPVICTDLPVLKELGANEHNSIILDMNMRSVPIAKIIDIRNMEFEYTPPQDKWDDVLVHKESQYGKENIVVKATNEYRRHGLKDIELGYIPECGETWTISQQRFDEIREFEKQNNYRLIETVNPLH